MQKFKYSSTFAGNPEQLSKAIKALEELGYEGFMIGDLRKADIVRTFNDGGMTTGSSVEQEERAARLGGGYNFKIEDEASYQAGLAISAIQVDDKYHQNEWVKLDSKPDLWGANWTVGKLYKLGGRYWTEGYFYVVGNDDGDNDGTNSVEFTHHKASPEEITEFFKEKQTNMKEIIGYRIKKDGPGFKKGLELTVRTDIKGGIRRGYQTPILGGPVHRVRFPDDVLLDTEWFEPIYKKDTDEVILHNIGTGKLTVVVTSEGKIKIPEKGDLKINVTQLRQILRWFSNPERWGVGIYEISYDENLKFIRVGCEGQDNKFSLSEIALVVTTYNKLNP